MRVGAAESQEDERGGKDMAGRGRERERVYVCVRGRKEVKGQGKRETDGE